MNALKFKIIVSIMLCALLLISFSLRKGSKKRTKIAFEPKGCVFRTVMNEESSAGFNVYKTPEKVLTAIETGLQWIGDAQNESGGWGAGSHYRQNEMNPHAVEADPATTAMVAMALMRSGNSLNNGKYATHLRKALQFLLSAVESSSANSTNITALTGTQIQTKLGANIDVILTSQFLSNVLNDIDDEVLRDRVKKCQDICVSKIQKSQSENGSISGSGWAGVLQSSFATNALEAAQVNGAKVDKQALEKARAYQKNNYNPKTGDVNTSMGAGIVLYSVTGSARASAKEARKVEEEIKKAKDDGRLSQDAKPSAQALMDIGYDRDQAMKYETAYEVYQSAKEHAQREDVMNGFGNNGGEEFLSYLQTGESMIINKDDSWQNWYDNISGRILKIQNENGSWNGHHCITSPVFCTATCLLILSVNNDIDELVKLGADN